MYEFELHIMIFCSKFFITKQKHQKKLRASDMWYDPATTSLICSLVWSCFFFRCLDKFNLVLKTLGQNLHSNLRSRCFASICRDTSLLDGAVYPQAVHQELVWPFTNKFWTSLLYCTPKTNKKVFHSNKIQNSSNLLVYVRL